MGVPDVLQQRLRRAVALCVTMSAGALLVTGLGPQSAPDAAAPVISQVEQRVPVGYAGPAASGALAQPVAPPAAVPALSVRRAAVAGSHAGPITAAPAPAVAAYQRAASIINATVECGLDWVVLAAIARVESDHGRGLEGGHRVGRQGRVKPALVGEPLDGRQDTGRVHDTDGGDLDADARWDAPVGAFGLLPATWAQVAVDADGDDRRDPHDVDDAALGAAVVLCAGKGDMSRTAALRRALAEYHQAPGFVAAVLALVERYQGQLAEVPDHAPPRTVELPDMPDVCACDGRRAKTLVVAAAGAPDDRRLVPVRAAAGNKKGDKRLQRPPVAQQPNGEQEPTGSDSPPTGKPAGPTPAPDGAGGEGGEPPVPGGPQPPDGRQDEDGPPSCDPATGTPSGEEQVDVPVAEEQPATPLEEDPDPTCEEIDPADEVLPATPPE